MTKLYLEVKGDAVIIRNFRYAIESLLALGRSKDLITYDVFINERTADLNERQRLMKWRVQGAIAGAPED